MQLKNARARAIAVDPERCRSVYKLWQRIHGEFIDLLPPLGIIDHAILSLVSPRGIGVQQGHIDDVQKLWRLVVSAFTLGQPHLGGWAGADRPNPVAVSVDQNFLTRNATSAGLIRVRQTNDSLDMWHSDPRPLDGSALLSLYYSRW
jgi:hypothetical protein